MARVTVKTLNTLEQCDRLGPQTSQLVLGRGAGVPSNLLAVAHVHKSRHATDAVFFHQLHIGLNIDGADCKAFAAEFGDRRIHTITSTSSWRCKEEHLASNSIRVDLRHLLNLLSMTKQDIGDRSQEGQQPDDEQLVF